MDDSRINSGLQVTVCWPVCIRVTRTRGGLSPSGIYRDDATTHHNIDSMLPMKTLVRSIAFAVIAAFTLSVTSSTQAADAKPKLPEAPSEKAEAAKPKRDWYPFSGIVASVDKQARTVALKKKEGERVLRLDAKSEIQSNGKPGSIADIKVGEYAHGRLHKDAAGKEVILGAKFDKEAPHHDLEKEKGKEKTETDKVPEHKAPTKPKN